MAHDRQLPEELQEPSNVAEIPSGKARQSLGVLANWWAIYAQIYKDDPTAELLASFREILKPLLSRPEILHEALLLAARQSPEFRPKPGRVYEIAETLMEKAQAGNRPKYLDEPKLSAEEREAALVDPGYQETRKKILGAKA